MYSDNTEQPAKFLERQVLSIVLTGLEETVRVAKETERRKLFNPLDYLACYLYRHNPRYSNRDNTQFEEIPFVKEEWEKRPCPPLPLSAIMTEDEAAIMIQSFYRGYLVRKTTVVQIFKSWQRAVRNELKAAKIIQRRWRRYLQSKHHIASAAGEDEKQN